MVPQPKCDFEPSPSGREQAAPPYTFPANPTPRKRESLAVVVADTMKLKKLSDAYGALKSLQRSDPRNWCIQANMHYNHCSAPSPNPDYYLQIHVNPFFFPWHRAYLFFYESILGQLIGDDSFALPYWEWATTPVVPDPFFDPQSPLYDPNRGITQGMSILDDQDAASQVDEDNVGDIVTNSDTLSDFQSAIEPGPHGAVHSWVGGGQQADMGIFETAARDPLFFAHHANVDRLWALWRAGENHLDPTDPAWKGQWYNFWDPSNQVGKLVSVITDDVLNLTKVNVIYATKPQEVTLVAERHEVSGTPFSSCPIPVPTKMTAPARIPYLKPALRLVIEGVEVPPDMALLIRVFVNTPTADADTPLDKGFVGTLFSVPMSSPGRPMHHMKDHSPRTMALAVPQRVVDFLGAAQKSPTSQQQVTVTVVPLGLDKRPSPVRWSFGSVRLVQEET